MITIWALGERKSMKIHGGQDYTYDEVIGQVSFYANWLLEDAFKHTKEKYPQAHAYQIGDPDGRGCVAGPEGDLAPGH